MSICYHPYAFDTRRFTDGIVTCSGIVDVCMLLVDCQVTEPDFGWSIDGSLTGAIISRRVHPVHGSVSLVDHVRLGLELNGAVSVHAEVHTLLGHVSATDGRLIDVEPFVGYLTSDEVRRITTLLTPITLDDAHGQDGDRRLLLRLFTTALESEHGMYWTWC